MRKRLMGARHELEAAREKRDLRLEKVGERPLSPI